MDEKAWFEQVYAQYADFLFRIGRRLLQGRDEDVLYDAIQDVFLTMWSKRAELTAHPNIGGWLVEALKFRMMAAGRTTARQIPRGALSLDDEEHPVSVEDAAALSPEQSAVLSDHIEQLRALLGDEQAGLFLDYTLHGYKARELGEKYGVSAACIWVRIARIKKKIAQHPEIFYVFSLLLSGFSALRQ